MVLVGCAEPGPWDHVLSLDGDVATGSEIYEMRCSGCHGDDGEGGFGPALAETAPNTSDEALLEVIVYGDTGMPAYDGILSDQEQADILAYLRDTFGVP